PWSAEAGFRSRRDGATANDVPWDMFSLLGETDQLAGTTARRISHRRFNPAFVEASAKSGNVLKRNRF
ncbi:hypothetical protein KZ287_33535, partial [Escherichia coli]|nr:hypothetical protein [Escherichia coli]